MNAKLRGLPLRHSRAGVNPEELAGAQRISLDPRLRGDDGLNEMPRGLGITRGKR